MKMSTEYGLPIKVKNIVEFRRKNGLKPYAQEQRRHFVEKGKKLFEDGYKEIAQSILELGPQADSFFDGYKKDIIGILDKDAAEIQSKLLNKIEREVKRNRDIDTSKNIT